MTMTARPPLVSTCLRFAIAVMGIRSATAATVRSASEHGAHELSHQREGERKHGQADDNPGDVIANQSAMNGVQNGCQRLHHPIDAVPEPLRQPTPAKVI